MLLAPGLTASVTLVVDDADTALALRSGDVPVLGTPRVIALAEEATIEAIGDALPEGRTTVGYQVQLAHLTPTPVGGTVVAEATLEQVEGRRLTFRVSGERRARPRRRRADHAGGGGAGAVSRPGADRGTMSAGRAGAARRARRRLRHAHAEPAREAQRAVGPAARRDQRRARRAGTDEAIKAVVITGAGPVFSAGFDLSEFERAAGDDAFGRELWASSDRYHETVLHFPLPTLAAINGPALAGGFDLAVLCDLRIASSTARFAHPERTFGDVVYGPLHDLVGGAVARELTIGGRELTADEALAVHLVGEVVAPLELMVDAARCGGRADRRRPPRHPPCAPRPKPSAEPATPQAPNPRPLTRRQHAPCDGASSRIEPKRTI